MDRSDNRRQLLSAVMALIGAAVFLLLFNDWWLERMVPPTILPGLDPQNYCKLLPPCRLLCLNEVRGWLIVGGTALLLRVLPPQDGNQAPIGETLLGILALLMIGGGHFLVGCLLLWTLRTTLDRARDLVVVRSGWLGSHCERRRLSEFEGVTVRPAKVRFASEPLFDIVLSDEGRAPLVIGRVTRSYDLARTVVDEISHFTHLPAA